MIFNKDSLRDYKITNLLPIFKIICVFTGTLAALGHPGMQVIKDIKPLQDLIFEQKKSGQSIGLVPTMGALHAGHHALIQNCLDHSDFCVCSIYVNPTQFNNPADLEKYPRPLETDLEALRSWGCDLVFTPTNGNMYENTPLLSFNFGHFGEVMEGKHRPGHFNGVALVVAKLFNLVQPHQAYFGQKDWQQLAIIRQLVADLSFPVELKEVPIVREDDGLALSSRNRRLTQAHRKIAPQLFQALTIVKSSLEAGKPIMESLTLGKRHLEAFTDVELEYLQIVNSHTLMPAESPLGQEPLSVCIAAYLGEIRLIDNVRVS